MAEYLQFVREVENLNVKEEPGVYIIRGKDGTALYVGASKNLRKRLIGASHHKAGRINRYPAEKDLEVIQCSIDELCEIELKYIAELNPIYNRSRVGWCHGHTIKKDTGRIDSKKILSVIKMFIDEYPQLAKDVIKYAAKKL